MVELYMCDLLHVHILLFPSIHKGNMEEEGVDPLHFDLEKYICKRICIESPPFVVMFVKGLTLYYNIYCCLKHCSTTLWWLLGWSNVIFYVQMVNTKFPTK
jgi:hypothetical protein